MSPENAQRGPSSLATEASNQANPSMPGSLTPLERSAPPLGGAGLLELADVLGAKPKRAAPCFKSRIPKPRQGGEEDERV